RRDALLLLLGGLFAGSSARAEEQRPLVETPSLAAQVAAGRLPPVARRIPEEPEIAIEPLGRPGGQLRILMAGPKDTRLLVVYGYARLIRYTPLLTLEPDIAKAIDIEGERVFTLHLRRGHKWSD